MTSLPLTDDTVIRSNSDDDDDDDAATLSDGRLNEVRTINSSAKTERTASPRSDGSPVPSATGNSRLTPVERPEADSDEDVFKPAQEKPPKTTTFAQPDLHSPEQRTGGQRNQTHQQPLLKPKTGRFSRRQTLIDEQVSATASSSSSSPTGTGPRHYLAKSKQRLGASARTTASASAIRRSVSPTRQRRRLDALTQRRSLPLHAAMATTMTSILFGNLAPRTTFTDEQRAMLLRKFGMIARLTVLLHRVLKDRILRNKNDSDLFAGSVFVRFDETDDNEQSIELELSLPIFFNKHRFRANHKLRLTDETRRILSKPPTERTEAEQQYVQRALLSIKSIADYPVRMQKKLAGVGMYHRFESKRVIVRQGQRATAFYFILSGSVVVLVRDHPLGVPQPRAVLRKGMTFGELAIVQGIPRQSAVVAIDAVELMGIDVENFHAIFMLGGVKMVNDPDHQQFLRSLGFLAGWPIDRLSGESSKCVFNYFRTGDVLVRDSKYSNWIVVVKSGSLKVLKMLKKVESQPGRTRESDEEDDERTGNGFDLSADSVRLQLLETRFLLSELNVPLLAGNGVESPPCSPVTGHGVVNWAPQCPPAIDRQQNPTLAPVSSRITRTDLVRQILKLSSAGVGTIPEQQHIGDNGDLSSLVDRAIILGQNTSQGHYLGHGEPRVRRVSRLAPLKRPEIPIRGEYGGGGGGGGPLPPVRRRHGSVDAAAQSMVGGRQQIRTVSNDLDASKNTVKQLTQADFNPQFIHVQTLTKGDVFGLRETVLATPQPSVSVVSNGAECVLIDKSFYKEHAPVELLKRLATQCSPYPSDEEMQQKLSAYVKWRQFCAATFKETVRRVSCNAVA